jgi:hypothetical protein
VNGAPPYFAAATDMTIGHMRCRAVAAWPLSKEMFRWFASPFTLTTAAAVATLELAPTIQVSFAPSVVPVLPMSGTLGTVAWFDELPVPPDITRASA